LYIPEVLYRLVSDIAIFVLKRDVKLQLTNQLTFIQVTTYRENLERSGNCKVVRENGKSRETIISSCRPAKN